MKTMLTMLGLSAVLLLGCGEPASVSDAGSANSTTLASISPENQATCVYAVKGMTWGGCDTAVENLLKELPGVASATATKTNMTATIVYDKSVFDVNSVVSDEGRYKFTVQEDSSAGSGDEPSADDEALEEDKPAMEADGDSEGADLKM